MHFKEMIKNQKLAIYIFIILYLLIGSYLSITNGITSDEYHEQNNWIINLSAAKEFITTGQYESFLEYWDRYHGIAFHLISQPIQFLIKDQVTNLNNATEFGGLLLSKHLVVFLIFSISSIFFFLIFFKITKNKNLSLLACTIYLLYPYLFGHAQFNPKDIPFLSFWLINTFISLKIFEDLYFKKKIKFRNIIFLSFFTAFLISIRIVGFLIFIQYLISLLIYIEKTKISYLKFFKLNYKNITIFIISILSFVIILNPIFWHNPLEIINSIKWMGKYPQNIGTLTNGSLMYSLNLPSSYYFIWLFFKLPILIIIGYCLFPLVESKIFKEDIVTLYYGTATITAPIIIVIFILKDVALYDELRHLLFIFPLIFITALTNLFYFLKEKIFKYSSVLLIAFFILENINLNPYQYTWLNSFAKIDKIEKNFEVDYWGVSNKNIQNKIINYVKDNNISKSICIYGDFYVKEFLKPQNFECFKLYSQVDEAKLRPFIAYKNLRNVKRSDPKDCKLIWDEKFNYSFYKKDISAATLWFCD